MSLTDAQDTLAALVWTLLVLGPLLSPHRFNPRLFGPPAIAGASPWI